MFQLRSPPAEFSHSLPTTKTTNPIVTGASVVGIRVKDGVVLGADTNASYGSLSRFRNVQRVLKFGTCSIVGGGGDFSDFQEICSTLSQEIDRDSFYGDGTSYGPRKVHGYLTTIMYNRRSKVNPLWNQLIVAGHQKGESYMGFVDLYGTSFEENVLATGMGAHIAIPILRNAYREDMSLDEAKELVTTCLRTLFYRDCYATNKIHLAVASAEGISISDIIRLDTNWMNGEDPSQVLKLAN